jgi:WD40 repeat protein
MKSKRLLVYFVAGCFVIVAVWLGFAWFGWGPTWPRPQPKSEVVEHLRLRESFGQKSSPIASLAFDRNGKTLASGHKDGTINLWDAASGKAIKTLEGHTDVVTSVTFLPDGKTLVSGSLDRTIKLWNLVSGKDDATLEGHSGGITSVSLNPIGTTLASGGRDRTIKVWDAASGKAIRTLEGHADVVTSVAFRPDGKTLASGSLDRTIKLWNLASGKEDATLVWDQTLPFQPLYQGVACLTFSPDGKTLASGAEHIWVFHWDVDSGKIIGSNAAQNRRVNTVVFNPDGKTLASCCIDDSLSIKLWDMTDVGKRNIGAYGFPSLECLWQEPHDGYTNAAAVAFSPDGATLVSGGGRDGKIKFWDVASNKGAGK